MKNLKQLTKSALAYVLLFVILDLLIIFGLRGVIDLIAGRGYRFSNYLQHSWIDSLRTFIFFFFWGWVEYTYRKHQAKKRANVSNTNPK
ncbi:hypothetical protein [Oenococcus sp.]|uniref:hypothetical protein n=1 Tax=Oenococcus sp. TaxID=1979414 RepID=UPI0039EAFB47